MSVTDRILDWLFNTKPAAPVVSDWFAAREAIVKDMQDWSGIYPTEHSFRQQRITVIHDWRRERRGWIDKPAYNAAGYYVVPRPLRGENL